MKIIKFISGLLFPRQCCDEIKIDKRCTAYCIKNYGHYGNHKAWAGKEWK